MPTDGLKAALVARLDEALAAEKEAEAAPPVTEEAPPDESEAASAVTEEPPPPDPTPAPAPTPTPAATEAPDKEPMEVVSEKADAATESTAEQVAKEAAPAASDEKEAEAPKQTAADDGPASKKRKLDGAPPTAAAAPPPKRTQPLSEAQYWYYLDQEEKKQGPFYPGIVRDWYNEGYFPDEATRFAPSFMGEIPRAAHFQPLKELFSTPLKESAFQTIAPGIAHYPVAALPPQVVQVSDQDLERDELARDKDTHSNPAWLENLLERQKLGGGGGFSGPILKGSFVN